MAHGSKFHRHAGFQRCLLRPEQGIQGKEECLDTWAAKKITIQNLEVVRVDAENNLLLVKGAVPGPKKALVTIKADSEVRK